MHDMRRFAGALAFFFFLAGGTALAGSEANPGFEKLKGLIGSWEGRSPDGEQATVRYSLVSSGSALLEAIGGGEHADMDMVTVYHPDGTRLMMTHYCSAQNQPRMVAEQVAGPVTKLHFTFLDATNLAAPDAGHMHDLVVTFDDSDHFTQAWTWRQAGKDKVEVFHWARVK